MPEVLHLWQVLVGELTALLQSRTEAAVTACSWSLSDQVETEKELVCIQCCNNNLTSLPAGKRYTGSSRTTWLTATELSK